MNRREPTRTIRALWWGWKAALSSAAEYRVDMVTGTIVSTVWLCIAITILGTVGTVYLAAMSGALALWMTKSEGIQGLLVGAEWILGGIVAPVALLPGILPFIVPY